MQSKYRWRTVALAAVVALGFGATSTITAHSAQAANLVTVNPQEVRVADFQGWGTAMAWWADRIGSWPEPQRSQIADLLYSPTAGLGLNIVRYNLGGSRSPNPNTDMRPGGAVPTYLQSVGTYDWSQDAPQRWFLDAAKARGADTFEAFVNSPPYWMTVNGDPRGNGCSDNLAPANYQAYVQYLATVLKHFRDTWGTNFQTVSPFNEVDGCWGAGGLSEGNTLSTTAQSAILTALKTELTAQGLSTEISAPEAQSLNAFAGMWNAYTPAAKAAVSQINVHTYGGSQRDVVQGIAANAGKRLWMSEIGCCDAYPDSTTDMRSGLAIADKINLDLTWLKPSAWVLWQAVEDEGIQQSYNINWGGIHADMSGSTHSYTIQRQYYAYEQFTKFIRPGYQIIGNDDSNTVSAYSPADGKVVVVLTNSGTTATTKTVDLNRFTSAAATAQVTRTSPTETFASLPVANVTNGQIAATLPAQSITTYVVSVGAATGSPTWDPTAQYEIVNVNSGKSLAISAGSTANGGAGVQWTATGGPEQRWTIVPAGNTFTITNVNSGKALSISGESTADGAAAVQWAYGGGAHQQWALTPQPGGGYSIVNRNSGKPLEISGWSTANGGVADQWANYNNPNQRWTVIKR